MGIGRRRKEEEGEDGVRGDTEMTMIMFAVAGGMENEFLREDEGERQGGFPML